MSVSTKVFHASLLTLVVLVSISRVAVAEAPVPVYPKLLKPGDTIMFVAPAADLDKERMMRAKKRLEERGYKIKTRDDLFAVDGYLAGSDERRAEELMQAFTDPEVDAIFPGTGGYGVTRILDLLDYDVIRQNPKLLIGYSDITALHAAINKKTGLVSYHSPLPMYSFGNKDYMTPFSEKYHLCAIEENPDSAKDYTVVCAKGDDPKKFPQPYGLGRGKARGRLVGGNLTLLAALEGTPYAIDTQDAILLIEDVGEAPYRVDRMLQQLRSAGKLAPLRGVLVGQFTQTERVPSKADQIVNIVEKYAQWFGHQCARAFVKIPEPKEEVTDPRFTVVGVVRQHLEPLGIPVLMNFPVGHHKMNCTLPIGGEVEIDADNASLTIIGRK